MYLKVRNKNIETMYPLILQRFPVLTESDKMSGNTYYAIDIGSLTELMELDALCQVTNDKYFGIKLSGTEITFLETEYEFEREL